MENVNTEVEITHGIDASLGDATASVNINEAGNSALALKAHADWNVGQVQITEVACPQPVAENTGREEIKMNNVKANGGEWVRGGPAAAPTQGSTLRPSVDRLRAWPDQASQSAGKEEK